MYDKFHGYLSDLESSFVKLAGLLHKKLEALEKFDLAGLDSILKEEQVFILFTKSFEGRVAGFRQQLGIQSEKLSEIIGELPPGQQPRFGGTFKRLTAALDEVKALNQKCQELTQERLYTLDKAIRELDKSAGTAYGKTGADTAAQKPRPGDSPHMFTKSV